MVLELRKAGAQKSSMSLAGGNRISEMSEMRRVKADYFVESIVLLLLDDRNHQCPPKSDSPMRQKGDESVFNQAL